MIAETPKMPLQRKLNFFNKVKELFAFSWTHPSSRWVGFFIAKVLGRIF